MQDEYIKRKRLAETTAKQFAIIAKSLGMPHDKIMSKMQEYMMRVMNDQTLGSIIDPVNEVIAKAQPLIDGRLGEILYDTVHDIPADRAKH